jgi:multiple sugar transport system substrate-binding protein
MKKLLLVMLIACSVVLSLSAGGKQEAAGQALAGEVTFWQAYPAVNEVYTEYAEEYMEEHPEARIVLSLFTARAFDDKLNTAMPAGTAGDILEGWDGQLWAYISAGLIAKPPQQMLDYYHETIMEFLQSEGEIYGMPTFVGLKFLFWNKDWFADVGLNRAPTTITEQMEYARKLTVYDDAGNPEKAGLAFRVSGGGYGIAEKWWMKTLGPMGMAPIEETGEKKWASNFDTMEAADSVQYYLDGLYKYKVDSFDIERDIAGFAKGKSAMIQKESQAIPFLTDTAPDLDYGISPMPGDEIRGTLAVVIGNYVNADCKNKALAWDVIKYFNTPERHRNMFLQTGWNPVRGDVDYSTVYEAKPKYEGLMDFPPGYEAYFYPANDSWSEIWPKTGEWLTEMYTREGLANDRAALEAECKAFSDVVNQILRENNEYAPK